MVDFDFGRLQVCPSNRRRRIEDLDFFCRASLQMRPQAVKRCKGDEADSLAGIHNQYRIVFQGEKY